MAMTVAVAVAVAEYLGLCPKQEKSSTSFVHFIEWHDGYFVLTPKMINGMASTA